MLVLDRKEVVLMSLLTNVPMFSHMYYLNMLAVLLVRGLDRNLTFHRSPTARANSSSPAMTLPAITPTGTSPFSPGLLTVTTTWTPTNEMQSRHDLSQVNKSDSAVL